MSSIEARVGRRRRHHGGQVRIRPADRLEALDVDLVGDAGDTNEGTEAIVPRVARDQRTSLADVRDTLVLGGRGGIRKMRARVVERPGAAHVDRAGGTALEHRRRRRLLDSELREQLRWKQVEIHFAVGIRRVRRTRGSDGHGSSIQEDLGEVSTEAADRDVGSLAVDVARDRDTRNAVEGFRDVGIGKLADVFRIDLVDDADRIALGVGRFLQALAIPGNDNLRQIASGLGRGSGRLILGNGCGGPSVLG